MIIATMCENGIIALNNGKMYLYLDDDEAENLANQLITFIEKKATLKKTENQVSLEFNREDY